MDDQPTTHSTSFTLVAVFGVIFGIWGLVVGSLSMMVPMLFDLPKNMMVSAVEQVPTPQVMSPTKTKTKQLIEQIFNIGKFASSVRFFGIMGFIHVLVSILYIFASFTLFSEKLWAIKFFCLTMGGSIVIGLTFLLLASIMDIQIYGVIYGMVMDIVLLAVVLFSGNPFSSRNPDPSLSS